MGILSYLIFYTKQVQMSRSNYFFVESSQIRPTKTIHIAQTPGTLQHKMLRNSAIVDRFAFALNERQQIIDARARDSLAVG